MAIVYQNAGAAATGAASTSVPYPTGIVVGDLLLLFFAYKFVNSFITPSGWTKMGPGALSTFGPTNVGDAGPAGVIAFYKIAVGDETGNITVTNTGGNSMVCRILRYSYDTTTKDMDIIIGDSVDNTPNFLWQIASSNWRSSDGSTILTGSNVSISTNDILLVVSGSNARLITLTQSSNPGFGIDGADIRYTGSNPINNFSSFNRFCRLTAQEFRVNGGSNSTNTFNYLVNPSSTTANAPCGGGVVVRLREVDKVTSTSTSLDPFGMMGFFGL